MDVESIPTKHIITMYKKIVSEMFYFSLLFDCCDFWQSKFCPNLKNVLMYLFSVHLYFYHNKSLRKCKNNLSSCLPNHFFSRCVQIFDLHCNEKFNFVGKSVRKLFLISVSNLLSFLFYSISFFQRSQNYIITIHIFFIFWH